MHERSPNHAPLGRVVPQQPRNPEPAPAPGRIPRVLQPNRAVAVTKRRPSQLRKRPPDDPLVHRGHPEAIRIRPQPSHVPLELGIAVEREASLQTLAESGITIDAELNSFLIESVF